MSKGENRPPLSLAEASAARLHSIDILRALAALTVVLYHARSEFSVGLRQIYSTFGFATFRPDIWLSYAAGVFSLGWLGVPVFFVLSGYCIHRGYAAKLSQPDHVVLRVRDFYKRRFFRIYPVYAGALVLTGVVNYLLSPGQSAADFIAANGSSFLLNLVMAQELFAAAFGENSVFWTLSIEAYLYLFYPLLFLVFRRYGPVRALAFAAVVSLITSILYWSFDLSKLFVHAQEGSPLFTSHLFLWTAGAYLAEIHAGRAAAPRGVMWTIAWVAALAVSSFLPAPVFVAWGPLLLAVGTFGLVSVAIPAIDYLCRRYELLMRPLYLLGVASYSLYATQVVAFHVIRVALGGYRSQSVLLPLASTFAAIGLAIAFFYLVERYTIRARPRQA